MDTTSYWSDSTSLPRFAKLQRDCEVDVAVIGGGITGVTAAYLLKRAGHSVALVERGRCGGFDTANTTAHLTCVTDERLHQLARHWGVERARAAWESGEAALDRIVRNILDERIDCDFKWVPGYLHARPGSDLAKERTTLRKDARLGGQFGFPAQYLEAIPWLAQPGVKFEHQAKFNPCKYLRGLLRALPGRGIRIFEHTEVQEVESSPLAVRAGDHRIRCHSIFLATHTPLMGKASMVSAALFQSKLFLYTSYAIGARIPQGGAPEACFWDTGDPYRYLRIDRRRGYDYAILGGEDHKTGQATDTTAAYKRLEKALLHLIPAARVDHRWSGQVIETPDGLPYIGETAPGQFVATGFGGNGLTWGTLGAVMAVDAFQKRRNPWAELFDVHRKKSAVSAWDYLKENLDYPYYMARQWLGGSEGTSLRTVKRNQGKILQLRGRKVAVYRDAQGKVSQCSPVCTHLKCIVAWNDAEKTWDCPCHGSRFAATGEVLAGPAEAPLEKIPDPS